MKLYNNQTATTNNTNGNRSTTNGVNTKVRTSNGHRYVSQFNENKEAKETSTNSTLNRLELHSNLTVNYPDDYLPYATARSKKTSGTTNANLNSSELNLNNGSENMTKQQRTGDQTTLNNGLIGNVIEPYFTWEDLSTHRNDQDNHRSKRIDSNRVNGTDDVLTGASDSRLNSPSTARRENNCTKNHQINNNFNSNLSANYQNFHADRELEEEVELFENQTELREPQDDVDYEDEDNLNDEEILAGYTRNGTLQSSNYMHNTVLGHRRLLMMDSARSTATVTSLQQQLDANSRALNDDSSGGITNQAFIGLHSCYGYPKCENLNCGNCNKAHLTANLGDQINTSSSSWFSTSSQSRTICSLGCCAILTTCLFIILAIVSVVGVSIYLSNITNQTKSNVLPLSGRFKVQSGDQFSDQLYNVSTREFQIKATKYEAILQSVMQAGSIEDSIVNSEVYAFRSGSLVVFFRVYLDRRKLMQDYELRLLPNVNHKLIGLDSLELKKTNEKEEDWLAKFVQNRIKYGIGQLNLIGTDSLVFLPNSILISLNYTDPLLYPKDDHFVNERLQSDKILGSRSDLDTERSLNSLMNLNSIYTHKNKTHKGRISVTTSIGSNDRRDRIKNVKKLENTNVKEDSSTTSTTTQPSTTKPNVIEIFTNTPSYTASTFKQTITMRPIIQRYTTPTSLIDKFNHSSFLYSSPAQSRVQQHRQNSRPLDRSQQLLSSYSNLLSTTSTTSTTTSKPVSVTSASVVTTSRPALITNKPFSTSTESSTDDSSNDSSEWTTVESVNRISNKKLMNLHTESPISIYLKLRQIRKQLMANNTRNQEKHHTDDKHEDRFSTNSSIDQNQDASNILRSHEAITGGFSPLTHVPVQNKSTVQPNKDKYLSIINNSFKNQNLNIVVTVAPLPPNHKLPLPTTSVHISSMDHGQWRPISPFNHKSDLFSMFKSNRLPVNSTQTPATTSAINKIAKNSTAITNNPSQSTTSKPKSNLKPINPSLPPKPYTPPTTSISQHIHRPVQVNKNNSNLKKNIKNQNIPPSNANNRTPIGVMNIRNDPFGHRPSSSNNIQNTALPNGLINNFNLNSNLNSNNWLLSRPPIERPNPPMFGQPLTDSTMDSMDQMFGSFNSFNLNGNNNPLGSFDEIPSLLRREDISETTVAPAAFYRESRTNLKNNAKSQTNKPNQLFNKEHIDLETLLGLTEFESLKLNDTNANENQNDFSRFVNSRPPSTTPSSSTMSMNRFQKRIGIMDSEFIDQEYYRLQSTRKPIERTTKPSIELNRINDINLDLNNLTSIDDRIVIDNKLSNTNQSIITTFKPSFKDDLSLNNFNDDIDLTGEISKFDGDGLIEMTTTLKDEPIPINEINRTNRPTTLSIEQNSKSTVSLNPAPTTPAPNTQMNPDCDPSTDTKCSSTYTCAEYLLNFNQKSKLCDGIMDCKDLSDELDCDYCKLSNSTKKTEKFICPGVKMCIRKDQACDGVFDCPNGADEEFCVSLANEKDVLTNTLGSINQRSTIKTYQNEGILVIRRNGQWAPLCLENSDVVSMFGSHSSTAYSSLNIRSSVDSSTEASSLHTGDTVRTNNKLFKGLSADTIQGENGDLIVANSNTATLSAYSLPVTNTNQAQPKIYPSKPWFEDEGSYSWQLDELGKAVCSLASFNELESINVTNLSFRGRQLSNVAADDQPKYYSMNQQNIMFRNSNTKWGNLFKSDTCASGKIASIRCKESSFECGVRPTSNNIRKRIIGGNNSRPTSWPWMAAMYKEGSYQCGGVLIGSQFLLSAAHCFQSSKNAYWTARLGVLRRGSHFENPFEQLIRISHIIIHPDYADKGFLNDIVLLKLEKPVKFSDYVRPLCLPDANESSDLYHDKLCTIVGWGKLYENHRIFPDTLQELKLPVISTEECRRRTIFLPLYKISDSQICAGWPRGGKDACLGDSGGPLMCPTGEGKWSLIGITSNGDGCGRPGRPGIYSNVIKFVDWIEKEMSKKRPLVPVDSELLEKYSNKELLDELTSFNSDDKSGEEFLNAEFVLSENEKQELMKDKIRTFDKNSRTYTSNLRIASEFKNPTITNNQRISRRMALARSSGRRLPKFIEQDEIIDFCPFRCPLGKCLKLSEVCNNRIDCVRDGSDEKGC